MKKLQLLKHTNTQTFIFIWSLYVTVVSTLPSKTDAVSSSSNFNSIGSNKIISTIRTNAKNQNQKHEQKHEIGDLNIDMERDPSIRSKLYNVTNEAQASFENLSRPTSMSNHAQGRVPGGSGSGGFAAAIPVLGQHLTLTSTGFLEVALTGIQYGLMFYLGRSIWKAIVEVVDELDMENSAGGAGGAGGGPGVYVDEHDSLLFSEEGVNFATDSLAQHLSDIAIEGNQNQNQIRRGNDEDGIGNGRNGDSNTSQTQSQQKNGGTDQHSTRRSNDSNSEKNMSLPVDKGKHPSKKVARQSAFASTLASRLLASGLPLDNYNHEGQTMSSIKTVKSVLKSLTRTEGKLLMNALLSPDELPHIQVNPSNANTHANANADRNTRVMKMWDDIGGLVDAKEGLLDLIFPLMQNQFYAGNADPDPDAYASNVADANGRDDGLSSSYYGGLLSNPPGLLLYGPPGCGKTMMVRALAGTANARFLCVTPSTLFRKYVGETNINVKALFSLARKISPCIIFIDEMEGLFRERRSNGSEEHDVNRELKTEFMSSWDGIEVSNDGIVVVGATNRPFDVDSAFLRRMPRSFFVGLPDIAARKKILSSMLSNVPLDNHFNLDHIVVHMEGYTPSDMKEVLRTAALFPLRQARADMMRRREANIGEISRGELLAPKLRPLETNDVMAALQKVAPTPLTNDYRAALMGFASKASGRAFPPPQPTFGTVDTAYNAGVASMNNNGYYMTDLNQVSPQPGSFNQYEASDFDDDYSYDDEEESDS